MARPIVSPSFSYRFPFLRLHGPTPFVRAIEALSTPEYLERAIRQFQRKGWSENYNTPIEIVSTSQKRLSGPMMKRVSEECLEISGA